MKKIAMRVALGLGLLLIVLLVGGLVWVRQSTYQPDAMALASWERAEKGEGWYAFRSDALPSTVGVVFYTGGLVDSRAYAMMAEALSAQAGVTVVVPDVPLNLVIINADVAEGVIDDFPEVTRWVLGGHSLGAVGASLYAQSHPDVAGLFFWAGGSWEGNDLSQSTIPVLSIRGSDDVIYAREEWEASQAYAPASTEYVTIEGANHSYFGNYGQQAGDNVGTVDRATAQAAIVDATAQFITTLKTK